MLIALQIRNIALIEHAELQFHSGFHVISGETGAGKTAVMKALGFVLGDKASQTDLRKGEERGSVEACFSIEGMTQLALFLEESGVDHQAGEPLILKREFNAAGRSRAFVNHQTVQLTLIREIASHLVEIVGQHAREELRHPNSHLRLLDQYGGHFPLLEEYQAHWYQLVNIRKRLQGLMESESRRQRELEFAQHQYAEISEAQLIEGEEEELFSEYSMLNQSDELKSRMEQCQTCLMESDHHLRPIVKQLQEIAKIDPHLSEASESLKSALHELNEAVYSVTQRAAQLEPDPERLAIVDERLKVITGLKKKYGATVDEILSYAQKLESQIEELANAESQIESLQAELAKEETLCDQLAARLTQLRTKSAQAFSREIAEELAGLNMPKVQFFIELETKQRCALGDEKAHFFFQPNVGEKRIPIESAASGGELSRILLAIKALLSQKATVKTIVFDEVDANIGGETAVVVGEKLAVIGKSQQVFCITHFPQVARQSDHHWRIFKEEVEGRTLSRVEQLTPKSRKGELARMVGIVT